MMCLAIEDCMSLMLAEKGSVTLEYTDVPHKGHATSLAQADDAEAAVTPTPGTHPYSSAT
jgi:hypothetical protein